jgi:hypothetical protein
LKINTGLYHIQQESFVQFILEELAHARMLHKQEQRRKQVQSMQLQPGVQLIR